MDLQPEGKLLEEQVFSSPTNIKAYLNGIYVKLAGAPLYGETLTMIYPEIMAQRYTMTYTSPKAVISQYNSFSTYDYKGAQVSNKMAEIWTNSYNAIFNANRFLDNLAKVPGIIDARTDSTYRGEALAIRAMMHFDLLRLFGPMYSTADSTLLSIPYATSGEVTINPFLKANEVMEHIITDLSRAESLLSNDKTMSTDRKYRFTYYSVKALQARANLYRGNKTEALAAAMVLIQNAAKFPWVTLANINDKQNPDKVFTTEMILGVYNGDLYASTGAQAKFFSSSLADNAILAPNDARMVALYDGNDFRYGNYEQLWVKPGSKNYKTFMKYADIESKTVSYRNTVPLLKLSEMYYIAAECDPNPTTGVAYLNTVRLQRNLGTPVSAAQLTTELTREYQKEFFGEGQLFYYFKRNNLGTIPATSNTTGSVLIGTTLDQMRGKYVVPIPISETNNR